MTKHVPHQEKRWGNCTILPEHSKFRSHVRNSLFTGAPACHWIPQDWEKSILYPFARSSAVNQPFVMSRNALQYHWYFSMVNDSTQVFAGPLWDQLVVVPFQTDGKHSRVSVLGGSQNRLYFFFFGGCKSWGWLCVLWQSEKFGG